MTVVVGFDISKSATGWAVHDGSTWESGVWICPIKRPFGLAPGRIDADYVGAVADWLDRQIFALLGTSTPDHACVEQPMPGNSTREKTIVDTSSRWAGEALRKETVGGTQFDVTHFLHGLAVIACRVCARKNIPVKYIASQTWRPSVGVGRPAKGLSYSQRRTWLKNEAKKICALRGITVKGSDQAEACLLTLHHYSMLNPRVLNPRGAGAAELFDRAAPQPEPQREPA